jgi:hypothetical protein
MSTKTKIKTSVKAGGLQTINHNQTRIKTSVKAGGLKTVNHNQTRR